MQNDYDVRMLQASDVYRAYALAQHLFPDVDIEMWKAALSTEALRHNWLTVIDASGVIRGLCFVFARETPSARRQLEVPMFASVSLMDEKDVTRRLLEITRRRAVELHCQSIHLWSAGAEDWAVVTDPLQVPISERGLVFQLDGDRPALH
ncbi:hypothetical protein M8R20_01315 [Pseudomonas sp. R2.Fl]|nr:hypothetical protein [Pseudomonas sp. R2.Fl]